MFRNTILINLGLLLLVGLGGWRLSVTIDRFRTENDLAKIQPVQDAKKRMQLAGNVPVVSPPRQYNAADFSAIPNQNVFSDTRGKEDKAEANPVQEIPKLQPPPILVGMTVSGNQRFASVIDPTAGGAGQAPGRRTQIRRIGDVYRGWTIVDIADNQMVLEYGGAQEIIPVFDSTKPRGGGGKTPIIATRVINFAPGGSGAAGGGAGATFNPAALNRVEREANARAAASTPPAPPPATANIGNAAQSQAQTARPAQAPNARQVQGNAQQQPQAPATWNERTDDQGRRVIRTPFGDIPRPKDPPND